MKKMMIISDIHGSEKYLRIALKTYERSGFSRLLILGDLYYHGPRNDLPEGYDCRACNRLLNDFKNEILVLRGNCDAEVDQTISDFIIQDNLNLNFGELKIYGDHGHLSGPDKLPAGDWNVYLYGHYHKTNLLKIDERIIASPGSISLPRDGLRGYLTIDDGGHFELVNLMNGEVIKTVDF